MFTASVDVRLKPSVFDPQGQAVAGSLRTLGFDSLEDVRVGKHVEVRLRAPDEASARGVVERMCRELLANPILEDFSFTLRRDDAGAAPGAGGGPSQVVDARGGPRR